MMVIYVLHYFIALRDSDFCSDRTFVRDSLFDPLLETRRTLSDSTQSLRCKSDNHTKDASR